MYTNAIHSANIHSNTLESICYDSGCRLNVYKRLTFIRSLPRSGTGRHLNGNNSTACSWKTSFTRSSSNLERQVVLCMCTYRSWHRVKRTDAAISVLMAASQSNHCTCSCFPAGDEKIQRRLVATLLRIYTRPLEAKRCVILWSRSQREGRRTCRTRNGRGAEWHGRWTVTYIYVSLPANVVAISPWDKVLRETLPVWS